MNPPPTPSPTAVKAFVITGDRNAIAKKDFTGAFDPEAKAFMQLHNIPSECRLKVDLSKGEPTRRKQVMGFLEDMRQRGYRTNTLAVFCHGFTNRVEIGFRSGRLDDLVKALQASRSHPGPLSVLLYCCSTGSGVDALGGDNGFADRLRDKLCELGEVECWVDAHVTAGHTVRNPNKRRFLGMGSRVGGTGGTYIVAPGSGQWRKWSRALQTEYRLRFHWKSVAEIHQDLEKM